jgi:hypothetical protein
LSRSELYLSNPAMTATLVFVLKISMVALIIYERLFE